MTSPLFMAKENNDEDLGLAAAAKAESTFARVASAALILLLCTASLTTTNIWNKDLLPRSSSRRSLFLDGIKLVDAEVPTPSPTASLAPTSLPLRWVIAELGSCSEACSDIGRQCNQVLTRSVNDETKLKYVVETILGQTCASTAESIFDTAPRIVMNNGECQWNSRGSTLCSESTSAFLRICCCGSLEECPIEPPEDDEEPVGKGKGGSSDDVVFRV